jgi:hypothetical protein
VLFEPGRLDKHVTHARIGCVNDKYFNRNKTMNPTRRKRLQSQVAELTRMAAYKHAKDLKEIQDLAEFIMCDGMVPLDVIELCSGDMIRYSFPNNGREGERPEIAKQLKIGNVYEVARKEVYSSSTDLWLAGFSKPFNSVFFSRVFPQWENI